MKVKLDSTEIAELMKAVNTAGSGGYQGFLSSLQAKLDSTTGNLDLTEGDLERIPWYAFDYGTGGWETTLKNIFGRVLGSNLDR